MTLISRSIITEDIEYIDEELNYIRFKIINKPYIVSINRKTLKMSCTCFNGMHMGNNNKQVCKHKKIVLDILGADIKQFKGRK